MPRVVVYALTTSLIFLSYELAVASTRPDMRIQGLADLIGNTIVGVSQSGEVWSAYLDKNNYIEFLYASKDTRTGSWRQVNTDTICISLPEDHRQAVNTCKIVRAAGRGLDWLTYNESVASSQIVFLLPGKTRADQASYRSNLVQWRNTIIVGRTLKDKDIWYAALRPDNTVDFYYSAGSSANGIYYVYETAICMKFIENEIVHCRRPDIHSGKILWTDTETGVAHSEIVYLHHLPASPPKPQSHITSTAPPRSPSCTLRQIDEFKAACIITAVGEGACSEAISSQLPTGSLTGATAAALCSAAAQKLSDGKIDLAILGISTILGAIDGEGSRRMQENDFWSKILGLSQRAIAAIGSIELAKHCQQNVDRYCNR